MTRLVNEHRYGNVIIKVYRPELTEEERVKRENNLKTALMQFGKAVYEREMKGKSL